mmetsp:Transcript_82983/g.240061  ORF Transcript_82983/g.240061 Transcript_82983/m.240061 type:complete len:257 (-) Transcript_82983:761-1531(-)
MAAAAVAAPAPGEAGDAAVGPTPEGDVDSGSSAPSNESGADAAEGAVAAQLAAPLPNRSAPPSPPPPPTPSKSSCSCKAPVLPGLSQPRRSASVSFCAPLGAEGALPVASPPRRSTLVAACPSCKRLSIGSAASLCAAQLRREENSSATAWASLVARRAKSFPGVCERASTRLNSRNIAASASVGSMPSKPKYNRRARSHTNSPSCFPDMLVAWHWLTKRFATSGPARTSPLAMRSTKAFGPEAGGGPGVAPVDAA